MKKVKVKLGKRSYEILIGKGAVSRLKSYLKRLKLGQVAVVVTNPTINDLHGSRMQKALHGSRLRTHFVEVKDAEASKSAASGIALIKKLADFDQGRGVFVIAFGGGVVGDLAGFCASVYKRGIPYLQVPTTLLAQVDSSIGGKVAIDLPCGKNLIGSFYQPRLVLSDIQFLRTLKPEHIRQALAEIIKYGIIADRRLFTFLEQGLEEIFKLNPQKLLHVVEVTSRIKAKIVEQDETDKKGIRMCLNFGHTIGHAIETAAGYAKGSAHGYAVAQGMLVAGEIAKRLGLCSVLSLERMENLLSRAGLPTRISGLNIGAILKAQEYDKKFSGGKNRFVLPLGIGRVVVKEDIPPRLIRAAIRARMS